MKVFLTGYSGNLGRALARVLPARGHRVFALFHARAVDRRDLEPGVEVVWGDLGRPEELEPRLAGMDAVVHSAWDPKQFPAEYFEKANVEGSVALLEAAQRAGVPHFVYISSVGVYGLDPAPGGGAFDETSPLVSEERALDVYPWAKVRIEERLRERSAALGIALAIVRPGLLFSDRKPPAKRLLALGGRDLGLLVGSGANHLPYVHVDDVAELIARVVERPDESGTFNAAPTRPLPSAEFLRRWGARRARPLRVLRLPPGLFRLLGLAGYHLKRILGRRAFRPNTAYQTRTALRDVRYDSQRAVAALGWSDRRTREVAGEG